MVKLISIILIAGLIATQSNAEAADLTMALGTFNVSKSGQACGRQNTGFPEYRLAAGSGVGSGIGYISNASLGAHNPGAETVYQPNSIAYWREK